MLTEYYTNFKLQLKSAFLQSEIMSEVFKMCHQSAFFPFFVQLMNGRQRGIQVWFKIKQCNWPFGLNEVSVLKLNQKL